jgi:nucleoside-diphosphate-sugar epimerase
VFHLAAYGAYESQSDPERMVRTNVLASIGLMHACLEAGVSRLVNVGSSSEYGWKDHACREDEALEPNSLYAVTKAATTLYGRHLGRQSDADIVTLRLFSVYGPYEEPSRLIPRLILHGLRGTWPPLAHPDTAHDFVYVDDAVDALLSAARARRLPPGAVYNVGTSRQWQLRAIVDVVRRLLGVRATPRWNTMPSRRWDTNHWRADTRRIQHDLGWRPRYNFEDGFHRTVEWFLRNPSLAARYRPPRRRAS